MRWILIGCLWAGVALAGPTSVQELHLALLKANPGYEGNAQTNANAKGEIIAVSLRGAKVTNLEPLKGLPLEGLDLAGVQARDLSPLQGMRLTVFYAEQSLVEDIGVLKGMPLTEVYLTDTKVVDIKPLAGAKIKS